ncbi:MAG: bifunctional 2',3'-cyclic-nucleotide 2'-phosphodiesterase/3'-nucleotidase [Rhodobacteraceae bacterium]|nr:bifunctional 2',3'-cyclic-nucleotide 2'-phosphodiesterase/3'-nucleotidase [Paracoccaceae bacterium]
MTAPHPFPAHRDGGQVHLRLIATTDLHAHLVPYDYFADRPTDSVGLARAATLIAEARAEAPNTLVLDNGDFLQGNPLGDYMAYEHGLRSAEVHPVLAAMAAAGIEASTLGNHEFNYGLDFLAKSLATAPFPIVSANVVINPGPTPSDDRTLVPPFVLLDRRVTDGAGQTHSVRIGVIGFTPPQILQWDHHILSGHVTVRDIVATTAARVPELRAAGADLVIALAHSGLGAPDPVEGMENAATALARVPGIDAIIAGHTHRVFPSDDFDGQPGLDTLRGTAGGRPAVMAGFWGSHIGVIDLLLTRGAEGWQVTASASEARAIARRDASGALVATVASAPAVLDAARAAHAETLAYIRRPIGRLTAPLTSYFALVVDDPSVQIVAEAQRAYVAEMLQGTQHEGVPVLSAAGPFKSGGRGGPDYYTDIPAGDLALKNAADLYIYPNTVRAVRVTGAELREWLERSAGLYNRILPGQPDQMLIDPRFPNYNYDVIAGVTYCVDLGQPARYDLPGHLVAPDAHRITGLCHDGRPVADTDSFIVATNNYRAGGGGDFPGARVETTVFTSPDTNRDILIRHIHALGTIVPPVPATWRFVPMPGTSVLFDTGPGARAHLPEVAARGITEVGPAPGGFLRLRLAL